MSQDTREAVVALTVITFIAAVLVGISFVAGENRIRKQAIKHGAAIYAPDTGEFTWK